MKKFFNWHQKFTEKKRLYYRVTHYQSYWLSWLKGIVMGFLVGFFISCDTQKQNSEWIYLFDGETTNGWRAYNGTEIPKKWAAIDGCLTFDTQLKKEDEWEGGGDIIYYLSLIHI